jgi:ATP-binding cassette subfamily B protein AbcA/BmrA
MRLDEWRTSFGYVLQNSPLISGTIRDNIAYGCDREVSNAEIVAAARHANAYDFIMEFPEGFDKEVGEGGMLLSGGQRQRIAIARAMIVNPKVLLMDEATASLDYQSDRLIWEAAEKLMQGRTTILIAHDMNAVMSADNVVVMNSGNIEAVGTHTSLMKESPTYREYVSLQTTKGGAA